MLLVKAYVGEVYLPESRGNYCPQKQLSRVNKSKHQPTGRHWEQSLQLQQELGWLRRTENSSGLRNKDHRRPSKYGTDRKQFWKKGDALEIKGETGLVLLFSLLHGFLHWACFRKVDWSVLKLWPDQHSSRTNFQKASLLIKHI